MITTRTTHLQPTNNHKSRKVTLISLVNYDKYQFIDSEQPLTTHIQQEVLIHNTNTQELNTIVKKSSKEEYKKIGEWGEYIILLKDSKQYLKHKWKDEPLKPYQ